MLLSHQICKVDSNKYTKREFTNKCKENNQITFKPIRKLCLNFTQTFRHNNKTNFEIFIFLIMIRDDVTHTF